MSGVLISASFDNPGSREIRLLHEASRRGPVRVLLWSDAQAQQIAGAAPRFPQEERAYFLEAIRYVERVELVEDVAGAIAGAAQGDSSAVGVLAGSPADAATEQVFRAHGVDVLSFAADQLASFPVEDFANQGAPARRSPRVVVTGCYDWLHSGHVRFFEEAAELGELHVVVGHDANIALLKGAGHPLYPQDERRYMVAAIRHVAQAYVSTGTGWLDAEPEIAQIKPDLYVVNEDGDKPEKRAFCDARGIEYRVLTRKPKAGLPPRQSTELRGF